MRKPLIFLAALALALALGVWAEPAFKSLSVSQTVTSHTFASNTRTVTIVSDGANTCYFRLFNNRDTAAAATTAHSSLANGETITYSITKSTTDVGSDTDGSATYYRSISAICGAGETATWRIFSK